MKCFSLVLQLKWHPAQDSVVEVMATFWREKNSSSIKENLKLRRENRYVMPLFKIKKISSNCVPYFFFDIAKAVCIMVCRGNNSLLWLNYMNDKKENEPIHGGCKYHCHIRKQFVQHV